MLPNPAYLGYRAGDLVARALPGRAVQPVADAAGTLARRLMSGRRDMVERHQRRVRPELEGEALDRAVNEVFASYASYWVESFRLPGTPPAVLDARMTEDGYHLIPEALAGGHGAIIAMPHLGAWEWAAFWLTSVKGHPVTTVVEAVEPPELARWFVGLREKLGMEIVPLGPEAGPAAARALAANRVLSLLCDRDVAGGGIEVEFFGERTTLPGGPATLALRSGAPLLPATCYFDGDNHHGVVLPAIDTSRQGKLREDVARVTQDLARALEVLIRREPTQWHLLQPNWPSDQDV